MDADLRALVGGKIPTDRPIDGVGQTDVLLGNSAMGQRERLLSFIAGDLDAARWKQLRIHVTDVHPTAAPALHFLDQRSAAREAASLSGQRRLAADFLR